MYGKISGFPRQTVPSMEACGIDVFATVRANNFEIHTLKSNEEIADYFWYDFVRMN